MTPGPDHDGLDLEALLAFDRDHVWHPYSSALAPQAPYLVESAHGIRLRLRDRDGEAREVVDAMSSWWCAIHGYAVPELDAAARRQLGSMAHVMFGGLTHEPAIGLARRLVDLAPDGLEHVFLADSGSVSVEVAMKMALQWHLAAGRRRTRFFTIRGGYHGDTFSPMSVTDPVSGMHALFRGVLPEHVFAPRPPGGAATAPRRPRAGRVGARDPGPVCRARRLAGRRHRRAGAAGRRGHARLQPARAQRAARPGPPARGAGHPRRDRDRAAPHGSALGRGGAGRPGPRHPVRRQGPDRRLPDPGRGALHARGGARGECRRGGRADARPDVHGQPAGLRDRVGEPRPAHLTRHRGRGAPHLRRAGRRAGARGIPRRRWRRCGWSVPSVSCSCASRCGWPR